MDTKRTISWKRLGLFLLAMLMLAFVILPLPYYVEQPGSTIDLKEIVTVDKQSDKESGSFSLTSVGYRKATGIQIVLAQFNDYAEVVSKEEFTGGATTDEYNRIQQYYMESSQNAAIEQALKAAGKEYEMKFMGVYVLSVSKESNFADDITIGDTITKVDGETFESSQDLMDYIKSQKVGQEVEVTYLHDGETLTAKRKLIELETDSKPGIGITLTDHTEVKTDTKVEFDTESIGGPSAGLMFTLEIYEQLTNENIRHGKDIAGTGTINSDGEVGAIGGIDKKVVSASKSGAEIFFAPDYDLDPEQLEAKPELKTNYQEAVETAEAIGTDMKIVPVRTLQDALDYLKELD